MGVIGLDQFGGSGVDLALDLETVPGTSDVVVMGINRSSSPADHVYGAGKLYLARYTSSGKRLWVTRFGSAGGELDLSMDLLVTNTSAYATGRYLSLRRAGQKDHFVTRFSLANGEQLGTAIWDGVGPQFGANLALGSHLFATGIGLTPENRRPDEFGAGQDPFLEKRDPNSLALLKRITFGEGANREPWGGLVWKPDGMDPTQGTLYSAGWTFGQFEDDSEPKHPKTADRNAWVAAFDQDLNPLWSETFGDKRWPDWAWDLALDGDGYLYVCGHTLGAVPGDNRQFGEGDGFVLKLDTNLTSGKRILWAKNYGTKKSDDLKRLSYRDGRLYAAGHTFGDFAGNGNAGRSDAWVVTIDAQTGDVLERLQFGTDKDERAVLTVNDEGVFVAGSTEGELAGPNRGSADAYLLKIKP
jgi:hypothetical protein